QLPSGNPGNLAKIPGLDCVDSVNNFWAVRYQTANTFRLDYRTQSGTWITPPHPPVNDLYYDIWAFSAYGNGRALLVDQNSVVYQFDGTQWLNRGAWKE
ncbi:MAG: hypothetical protein N2510_10230, partial [Ignavibacteria bacterium]|nr:hypothetical protein [Ignavibacteria bacterium]